MHRDPAPASAKWQFWIDRGGTFTDIVARRPNGGYVTHKPLSEAPHYDDAALQGIRDLLGVGAQEAIPAGRLAQGRMGPTDAPHHPPGPQGTRGLLGPTAGLPGEN